MVAEVLLVNPSSRKRRRPMSALQAKYFGKKRGKKRSKSMLKASHASARSYRRNPIGFSANPRRKRRRSFRSFRRNPIGALSGLSLQGTVMPTVIGAGGAILVDLALGYLPLPVTMTTGVMRPVVRAGAAVGIGLLAGMLTSKNTGAKIMAGALTVVAYDSIKGFLQQNMPQLPLAGVGEYPLIEYADSDMGALVDEDSIDGMGNLVDEDSIDGMGALFDDSSIDGMGALIDEESSY